MEPPFAGFIVSIPNAGIHGGIYVPPDRTYRIAPPIGWEIIPGGDGNVEFRSRLANQGYWSGMLIAKEPAKGPFRPKEEAEINSAVAEEREDFRWVSSARMELPFGEAYLVVYEHTFQKLRMRTAEAHIVCGGWRYWMPFNAVALTFETHFTAYLECLRTFAPLRSENN